MGFILVMIEGSCVKNLDGVILVMTEGSCVKNLGWVFLTWKFVQELGASSFCMSGNSIVYGMN
jgi:hypothetical protein